jgi:hypothetical protein
MVTYYSEGAQPDLARASVAELYAFCLANKKLACDRLRSSEETAGLPDARPARRRVSVSRVFRNSEFARLGGDALGIAVFFGSAAAASFRCRMHTQTPG